MDRIAEIGSEVTDLMREAQHLMMSLNMLDSLSVANESGDVPIKVSKNICAPHEGVVFKEPRIKGSVGVIKEHLQKLLLPSRYEEEAKLSDALLS